MNDPSESALPNQDREARLAHLDIAKGIAIMAIVAIHNPLLMQHGGKLFNALLSFSLPLFFICSGMLARTGKSIGASALARTHALMTPYIATTVAIALVDRILSGRSTIAIISGGLYGTGATVTWVTLWFLPHLWLVSIATLLIGRCVEQQRTCRLALTLLAMLSWGVGSVALHTMNASFPQLASRGLPFSVDLLPLSLGYALIGLAFRALLLRPRYSGVVFFISAPIFLLLQFGPDAAMDLNLRRYDSGLYSTLSALTGACAVFSLAAGMGNVRCVAPLLARIGRASLGICIFHFPVQRALLDKLPLILQGGAGPILISTLALLVSQSIWWLLTRSSTGRVLFAVSRCSFESRGTSWLSMVRRVCSGLRRRICAQPTCCPRPDAGKSQPSAGSQ